MDGQEEIESNERLIDAKKLLRIEKEKKELLAGLAGGDFSNQKTKVAYILNLYPDARDSDVTLTLKYWETFQPDIFNRNGILPKDLFKLERMHYIVRARAKIQNEYNLFNAKEEVKRFRRKNEEKMNEDVIADPKPRQVVTVFADETGKNHEFVIVSAVWILTGRAVFDIGRAISAWKEKSNWADREIHFAKFGKQDVETLREYLAVIIQNREFMSFKSIAVERAKTRRKIEEVVEKLHEHMLLLGTEHEIESHRIGLPQVLDVTLDHEQSLDPISLEEMKRRINQSFEAKYADNVELNTIQTVSSKNSPLIQLADLIAGAVNRKLNHRGDKNYKDEMAEMVIQMLDLKLDEHNVEGLDVAALFKL